MHQFLRSIGFRNLKEKDMEDLIREVLQNPDDTKITSVAGETDVAVVSKDFSNYATGISVVGTIDEKGEVVPEYYVPYVQSFTISSSTGVALEKNSQIMGYLGKFENYRFGVGIIFQVRNLIAVINNERASTEKEFQSVCLSALASEGTVLLPIKEDESAETLGMGTKEWCYEVLVDNANEGNEDAVKMLESYTLKQQKIIAEHLHEKDVFSLVDSFMIPKGMQTDQYYFMGKIVACVLLQNDYTNEEFYRMIVEVNKIPIVVAIHAEDLVGCPKVGYRIKCHAWLTGKVNIKGAEYEY